MAINLDTQYPGKTDGISAAWPFGEPRNITAPDDGLGTPWEAALVKEIVGLQQALLTMASITPSGSPDAVGVSQYLQSLVELASGRAVTYDETGIANAYVLDVRTGLQGPASYFDGMLVTFTPGNNNSGVSTIDVDGLGIKNILRQDGVFAFIGGELVNTREITLKYNGVNFVLTDDFVTGTFVTASLAQNVTEEITIAHGLGTDDVEVVMSFYGSNGISSGGLLCVVAFMGVDERYIELGRDGISSPTVITAPAPGSIKLSARTTASASQTITINYTIRRRV